MNHHQRTSLAWMLVALFGIVTLIRGVIPHLLPAALQSALVMSLPLVFFVVHGSLGYRRRDLLVFAAITLVVSNVFENVSVLTGFPFGTYVYTDVLGPKIFFVPVLIGPAYLGTGYLTWTIARVIVGATSPRLPGHVVWAVPLLASFMMVAWDLAFDPIFSTISHGWIWLDGGSYFGVPLSNFMGWLLTTFTFLQLFALYLKRQPSRLSSAEPLSRIQSLQAILFYGLIAARYMLNTLTGATGTTVTDPAGVIWHVQAIYAVTGMVAMFTMGTFTILGLVKLIEVSPTVQNASLETAPGSRMPYTAAQNVGSTKP